MEEMNKMHFQSNSFFVSLIKNIYKKVSCNLYAEHNILKVHIICNHTLLSTNYDSFGIC